MNRREFRSLLVSLDSRRLLRGFGITRNSGADARRTTKAWGHEELLVNTELYCGKRMFLEDGHYCSLHKHANKDETFIVVRGCLVLLRGEYAMVLLPGDSCRISPNQWHRFVGMPYGFGVTEFLEISTHHDDADCDRLSVSGKLSDAQFEALKKRVRDELDLRSDGR